MIRITRYGFSGEDNIQQSSPICELLEGIITMARIGILIALACVVYQLMLSHTRSSTRSWNTAIWQAYLHDTIRSSVFLIPLGIALVNGFWFTAGATVVVFMVNLMMS